jgi:hypothetical protein
MTAWNLMTTCNISTPSLPSHRPPSLPRFPCDHHLQLVSTFATIRPTTPCNARAAAAPRSPLPPVSPAAHRPRRPAGPPRGPGTWSCGGSFDPWEDSWATRGPNAAPSPLPRAAVVRDRVFRARPLLRPLEPRPTAAARAAARRRAAAERAPAGMVARMRGEAVSPPPPGGPWSGADPEGGEEREASHSGGGASRAEAEAGGASRGRFFEDQGAGLSRGGERLSPGLGGWGDGEGGPHTADLGGGRGGGGSSSGLGGSGLQPPSGKGHRLRGDGCAGDVWEGDPPARSGGGGGGGGGDAGTRSGGRILEPGAGRRTPASRRHGERPPPAGPATRAVVAAGEAPLPATGAGARAMAAAVAVAARSPRGGAGARGRRGTGRAGSPARPRSRPRAATAMA